MSALDLLSRIRVPSATPGDAAVDNTGSDPYAGASSSTSASSATAPASGARFL